MAVRDSNLARAPSQFSVNILGIGNRNAPVFSLGYEYLNELRANDQQVTRELVSPN